MKIQSKRLSNNLISIKLTSLKSTGLSNFIIISLIILLTSVFADIFLEEKIFTISLLLSFLLSAILVKPGIAILKKLNFKQIIKKEGPKGHKIKEGTATMGGLLIIPISLIIGNILTIGDPVNEKIIAISGLTFSFMIIGVLDDWQSLRKSTNTGLTPKSKLFLQSLASFLFLTFSFWHNLIETNIQFPLGISFNVGILIIPLALFVIIAESNATNLTDGIDGLASTCGALIFTGLSLQLILKNNNEDFLLAVFSMVMAGSWLGFLLHNKNPAKIFMGDTGSLAMGAALSAIALLSNSLWALFIMGGIFLVESISVIIQVLSFKLTRKITGRGKRVFLMAPLHHHLELKGFQENEIVQLFWIITIILILIALALTSLV